MKKSGHKEQGENRVKTIGVRSKSVHLEIFRPCWRCMANSLKDPIEFVGLRAYPLSLKVGWDGWRERGGGWEGLKSMECRVYWRYRRLPEPCSPSEMGLFSSGSSRDKVNFYCTKAKSFPFPPFWAEDLQARTQLDSQALAPLASRGRITDSLWKHLLQGKTWGIMLAPGSGHSVTILKQLL